MDRRMYPALVAGLALLLMLTGSPARAEMIDCIDETVVGTVQSGTYDAAKTLSNIKGILEGMLAKINEATNTGGSTGGSAPGGENGVPPEIILHDLFGDHFSLEDLANCACPCPLCLALLSALTCDLPTPTDPAEDGVLPGEDLNTTSDPTGNGSTAAEQTPEPSSLVLVGLGSAGLLWWRRRQKGMSSSSAA